MKYKTQQKGPTYQGFQFPGPRPRFGGKAGPDGGSGWIKGVNIYDTEIIPSQGVISSAIRIVPEKWSGGPGMCFLEVPDEDVPTLITALRDHLKNKKNGLLITQPPKREKVRRKPAPPRRRRELHEDPQVPGQLEALF